MGVSVGHLLSSGSSVRRRLWGTGVEGGEAQRGSAEGVDGGEGHMVRTGLLVSDSDNAVLEQVACGVARAEFSY